MLTLKIVSPERVMYSGEIDSVTVPGQVGEFEILNNHAPIISTLVEGRVIYTLGEKKEQFHIHGGFVEVKKNEVSLCVEM